MNEELTGRGRLAPPEEAGTGNPLPVQPPQIRNDLWIVPKAFDHGPEKNLELWEGAEVVVDGFCKMAEAWDAPRFELHEPLMVALHDCRERIGEEIRRAKSELEMRREWAKKQPSQSEAWS